MCHMCQPCWILNFFFLCQAMCRHSTLTLIQMGMHVCGMSLDMIDCTLAFLIQIYFVTFWLHPPS